MELELYQIDAFTDHVFGGNPTCVVPLNEWLPDEILFKITQENAVAETAFFIPKGEHFHLRWFTPEIEMDLCGHATLATANFRPIKGVKGYYRANMKHGVSEVHSGQRHTLGIIFHDATS